MSSLRPLNGFLASMSPLVESAVFNVTPIIPEYLGNVQIPIRESLYSSAIIISSP